MHDMTLQDALDEVKLVAKQGWFWPGNHERAPTVRAILNAVASGDLIPKAAALAEVAALKAERDRLVKGNRDLTTQAIEHMNRAEAAEADIDTLRECAAEEMRAKEAALAEVADRVDPVSIEAAEMIRAMIREVKP